MRSTTSRTRTRLLWARAPSRYLNIALPQTRATRNTFRLPPDPTRPLYRCRTLHKRGPYNTRPTSREAVDPLEHQDGQHEARPTGMHHPRPSCSLLGLSSIRLRRIRSNSALGRRQRIPPTISGRRPLRPRPIPLDQVHGRQNEHRHSKSRHVPSCLHASRVHPTPLHLVV